MLRALAGVASLLALSITGCQCLQPVVDCAGGGCDSGTGGFGGNGGGSTQTGGGSGTGGGSAGGGGGGLFTLTVVSGDTQVVGPTGTLAVITVEANDEASLPLAGAAISWRVANGSLVTSSSFTDAQGRATAVVKAGRVAGPGKLLASLTSNARVNATATFVVKPAPVAFLSLAVRSGSGGAWVRVATVDAFGNEVAETATVSWPIRLRLSAEYGTLKWQGYALTGTVTAGGGTWTLEGTLVGGVFETTIGDPRIQSYEVTLESRAPLPPGVEYARWLESNLSDFEGGLAGFSLRSQGSAGTADTEYWNVNNRMLRLERPVGRLQDVGYDLLAQPLPTVPSLRAARMKFRGQVRANPETFPSTTCLPASSATVVVRGGPAGERAVEPVGGYGPVSPCLGPPTFETTLGLVGFSIDLTDEWLAGATEVGFRLETWPANGATSTGVRWNIDDFRIDVLEQTSTSPVTVRTTLQAGSAYEVRFASRGFRLGDVVYYGNGACPPGRRTAVPVRLYFADDQGSVGRWPDQPFVRVTWNPGFAGRVALGASVTYETSGFEAQLVGGALAFTLAPPAGSADTSTLLTIADSRDAGFRTPLTESVAFKVLNCHSTATASLGTLSWADGFASATTSSSGAFRACATIAEALTAGFNYSREIGPACLGNAFRVHNLLALPGCSSPIGEVWNHGASSVPVCPGPTSTTGVAGEVLGVRYGSATCSCANPPHPSTTPLTYESTTPLGTWN